MTESQKYIHFHRYSIGPEEKQAVLNTLDSGWITKGPQVAAFEQAICDYTEAPQALALNSCTAGLHLALLGYQIGPGDEVITTPLTFVATANMIVAVGATPILVDVNPETLNLDPEQLKKAITPRTKALLPVHLAGQPCEMDAIIELGKTHGIPVIEDAAHAIGSGYHGKKIGNLSDVTVFSFYATKNITTGEGGMLTTPHTELMQKLRPLSLHGLSQDAWKRYSAAGYRHYTVEQPGYKYNMTDLQAALGLEQLKKCDLFTAQRAACVKRYEAGLSGLPLRWLKHIPNIEHSHHLFPILLDTTQLNITRDQVISKLHERGVGSGVHFLPLHFHPFYQKHLSYKPDDLPHATQAGHQLLSLPLYPNLSREDQDYVIDQLREILLAHQQ